MKMIVVALALVAVAVAAPPSKEDALAEVVRSAYNQSPEGSYQFGFETQNGIVRDESGQLKQVVDEEKKPHDVVVVRGSYSYISPEGVSETIQYEADEEGYRAVGPSIPVAPVARR